jgi:hypothetical protein
MNEDTFELVSEYVIRRSSENFMPDEDNAFKYLLIAADDFRKANMTPIFLYRQIDSSLRVAAIETFGKMLH